jgi:hypothetical protein
MLKMSSPEAVVVSIAPSQMDLKPTPFWRKSWFCRIIVEQDFQ